MDLNQRSLAYETSEDSVLLYPASKWLLGSDLNRRSPAYETGEDNLAPLPCYELYGRSLPGVTPFRKGFLTLQDTDVVEPVKLY